MAKKDPTKQPIVLIKSAFETILNHPAILFPFTILAFIQVLILEIIYFAPRYPLSTFFAPMIQRMEGEVFLHYPFNYALLNKWFQHIQIPVFVLCSSLLIGAAVVIIDLINNEKKIKMRLVFRRALGSYIHLLVSAGISVAFILGFGRLYGLVIKRALAIRSTAGIFFLLKKTIILSAPYVNLFFAVLIASFFAFVIPIIIIEKKNVFAALIKNGRMVLRSFWFILVVMLIPALMYVPVLLLKSNSRLFQDILPPEGWGLILILGIIVTLLIDAIQYTAMTTYYLLKKESK